MLQVGAAQSWEPEQHPGGTPRKAAAEGQQSIAEVAPLCQSGLEPGSVSHGELLYYSISPSRRITWTNDALD